MAASLFSSLPSLTSSPRSLRSIRNVSVSVLCKSRACMALRCGCHFVVRMATKLARMSAASSRQGACPASVPAARARTAAKRESGERESEEERGGRTDAEGPEADAAARGRELARLAHEGLLHDEEAVDPCAGSFASPSLVSLASPACVLRQARKCGPSKRKTSARAMKVDPIGLPRWRYLDESLIRAWASAISACWASRTGTRGARAGWDEARAARAEERDEAEAEAEAVLLGGREDEVVVVVVVEGRRKS